MKEEVEKVKREEGRGEDPSFCCCLSLFRILIRHVTLSLIVANDDDDGDDGEDDDANDESKDQKQKKSERKLMSQKHLPQDHFKMQPCTHQVFTPQTILPPSLFSPHTQQQQQYSCSVQED